MGGLIMAELELSESLKKSDIEEIRTLGLYIIIIHKNAGRFEVKIKENPYETGRSLERKCGKLLDPLLVQNLVIFITNNWEHIEIKPKSKLTMGEPEPFEPKYQFPTFEEWQISVENLKP
jgi:hypothetical protein